MSTKPARARLGSRGQPEESRTAILQAAIREFAREGVSGARTDAIARAAKVNKALLYYYFRDKEALYAAVVETVGCRQPVFLAGVQPAVESVIFMVNEPEPLKVTEAVKWSPGWTAFE